jgi:hypothetical protein
MRQLTSVSLAVIASCCTYAAAACQNPAMVSIPDGKSSTLEQMVAAQTQVKAYMAGMQDFLSCVDNEASAKGENAPAEYKSLMITRHNSAVTEMEAVAAAFNEQLKAYKAANPAPAAN